MKKIIFLTVCFMVAFLFNAWADDSFKKACPNGIIDAETSLIKKIQTSYEKTDSITSEEIRMYLPDTRGKCLKISSAEFIYLIDKKHAIYRVTTDCATNPLFYLEFLNSTVKSRVFSGIVKGVGYFKYKDREGIPRKIPHAIVLKEYKQ